MVEFDERTTFPLNDGSGKQATLINELVIAIADKGIQLIENILEGQDEAINVKHRKGITVLRTQMIICSTKDLWNYSPSEQEAILNRCHRPCHIGSNILNMITS